MTKKCSALQVNLVWTKDCAEQLNVFEDRSVKILSLIIIKGKGLWINAEEKNNGTKELLWYQSESMV